MTRSTTYEYSKSTTLVFAVLVAWSFGAIVACGDDADASVSDSGTDDAGETRKGGEAGVGGSKAGADDDKAGASGSSAGAAGTRADAEASKPRTAGRGGANAGDEAGASGGSPETGVSSAGPGDSAAPPTVTVTGVVVDITNGTASNNFDHTKYPLVPGVKVCVYGDDGIPCVTTDAKGEYALSGLPENLDVYLAYTKDSFAPTLFQPVVATGHEMPAMLMVSAAYRDSFAQAGGIAPDEDAGLIYFAANLLENRGTSFHQKFGNREVHYLRGFSVRVAPAPKAGPVYVADSWMADASLTKSSRSGWGIVQASPGDYTLTFEHPAVRCPPVTTKVAKGWVTLYAGTVCSPGTDDADAGI